MSWKACRTSRSKEKIRKSENHQGRNMIKEYWNQIAQNRDVRQNLSLLRQEVKDKGKLKVLSSLVKGQEEQLAGLLWSEDAKTRKNAAPFDGDLGNQEFLSRFSGIPQRGAAFCQKRLSAIGSFNYSAYLEELKEQLCLLGKMEETQRTEAPDGRNEVICPRGPGGRH